MADSGRIALAIADCFAQVDRRRAVVSVRKITDCVRNSLQDESISAESLISQVERYAIGRGYNVNFDGHQP